MTKDYRSDIPRVVQMKEVVSLIIKASLVYCALAAAFSLVGIPLAEKTIAHQNPLGAISLREVVGHVLWGLIAGIVTLSLRYVILGGFFAVLIDADHLVGLIPIDSISRMSHSLAFGAIAIIVMLLLFGKKKYLLAAVAFAGVFTHMSYDTFAGEDGQFPLFAPFYTKVIHFPNTDWIFFEIAAIIIVGVVAVLINKQSITKLVQN